MLNHSTGKPRNTLILAHYYTTPEVQALADHVGDSLDLAQIAQREAADRIVFAGVRFMAETAKLLNPQAEVILPDAGSTCSLVTQTDITRLAGWREQHAERQHVAYINSSVQHKALADWIVTSRNVQPIIESIYRAGQTVAFSPDRNMGAWLNAEYGYAMPLWSAVCEVHDRFKDDEIARLMDGGWADGGKYLIAHPESPLPVLNRAHFVGSTRQMLDWVRDFPHRVGRIYVATEEGLLYNLRALRPELDIQLAPIYSGCQCNSCPYMKRNSVERVEAALRDGAGLKIDYIDPALREAALRPIKRMLAFSG